MNTKKLGYCTNCGHSLWENIEHKCEENAEKIEANDITNPLISEMFRALFLADAEFSGEKIGDEGRARAAVRRVLKKFNITKSDKLFYSIQTTAEACPPASWDDIL